MGLKGKSNSLGYSDMRVDGNVTLKTDVLMAVDLTADVTLTVDQCTVGRMEITTGSNTKVMIIPAAVAAQYAGKIYIVMNNHATLASGIKVAGGSTITIAATKCAMVQINGAGTEVIRVTLDA